MGSFISPSIMCPFGHLVNHRFIELFLSNAIATHNHLSKFKTEIFYLPFYFLYTCTLNYTYLSGNSNFGLAQQHRRFQIQSTPTKKVFCMIS